MSRVYNFSAGPATLPVECLEEAQRERCLDRLAIDLLGPCPVEVDHRLETPDLAVAKSTFLTSSTPVVRFELADVLEALHQSPPFLRGEGDDVVDRVGGVAKA